MIHLLQTGDAQTKLLDSIQDNSQQVRRTATEDSVCTLKDDNTK